MKTSVKKFWIAKSLVLLIVFVVASCSTEKIDDLAHEVEKNIEQAEDTQGYDLKNGNSAQNRILAEIRQSTAKYQNLNAAAADGYALDPHCVEHPYLGGMGQHAVNMGRIGPFVVASEPGVLVYEPTKNGRYRLVAVEYLVPAVPWDGNPMNDGPPMLGEIEFDDHREIIYVELLDDDGNVVLDENGDPVLVPVNAKGGPPFPHYQLHVWVWKNNPLGMYFPFNPNVSCEYAGHGDMH